MWLTAEQQLLKENVEIMLQVQVQSGCKSTHYYFSQTWYKHA